MPSPDQLRDRRTSGRIPVSFPVEMQDLSFAYQGTAVNLSSGGMRVRLSGPAPAANTDVEIVLRPAGAAPLQLQGRVMHGGEAEVGVAFAVGDPKVFEAALDLYESLLMRDPKLAIGLKKRPSSLAYTQRLYPLPPRGATLSGPEQWVHGLLGPQGSLIWDLRRAIGAEWAHVAHVPFALLERGLASLQPAELEVEVKGAPVAGALPRKPGRPA